MTRRGCLGLSAAVPLLAQRTSDLPRPAGLPAPRIRDIRVIATAPVGLRLTIVKVITDQDGLYGYGCGTFTQRADLVSAAVDRYLKPFLVGKPADRIPDVWHACYNSSYWRNDPVLNNALSGVDLALWDIKGRQAGMPVYQLLGGKCREAAECYVHAGGMEIDEVIDSARKLQSQGFHHIRVQVGVPNQAAYSSGGGRSYGGGRAPVALGRNTTGALHDEPMFEPAAYIRRTLKLFETCRAQLGSEVELLHDTHERITPTQATQFARDAEPFRLFFLEDIVSPEDLGWYRIIRRQTTTPLAMGELFNNPHEWQTLVSERLIDYLRIHMSQAGGLPPCRAIAAFAEAFGVKTAWHGPGDVSPVGHAANLALDIACPNFGIRELVQFSDPVLEVFEGCPKARNGYLYANERPGWGTVRRRDGTVIKQ